MPMEGREPESAKQPDAISVGSQDRAADSAVDQALEKSVEALEGFSKTLGELGEPYKKLIDNLDKERAGKSSDR